MFVQAVVFAVQAAVVLGGAARYPSGLNPALCPNYPHCDNALLAAYAQPASSSSGAVDYNDNDGHYYDNSRYNDVAGHYGSGYQHRHPSASAGVYNGLPSAYTEPGYPAGLTSSNCPNYPYCSHQVPAEAHKYVQARRYPSGVPPQNCPNYPYCYWSTTAQIDIPYLHGIVSRVVWYYINHYIHLQYMLILVLNDIHT